MKPNDEGLSLTNFRTKNLDEDSTARTLFASNTASAIPGGDEHKNDTLNYALLIALYTLQGIPMGLSASIPFLIQQKVKLLSSASFLGDTATNTLHNAAAAGTTLLPSAAARLSYNANAIFALCSWPFSLKLLWAPIVDAVYIQRFGRRKSWLVPVQTLAGLLMVFGSNYVERQFDSQTFHVQGVTAFFLILYALMATQDIAVDGWALTMLSKQNRGRGPVCNSVGQNIGYFISFVGFLALNDVESCNALWRPLLGLPQNLTRGMVSLGGFMQTMGYFMLVVTTLVALLKRETDEQSRDNRSSSFHNETEALLVNGDETENDELDASKLGLKETYHRLWAVCKLPAVRWLFLILFTYRLPTALTGE
jgi:PAT family acetyl-CoA transporter-like MFS transporter 1